MNLDRQEILLLTGLVLLALAGGWLSGYFGSSFFFAAMVWAVIQHRERSRLIRWADKPISRPSNRLNPWRDLADQLYRGIRRARGRHSQAVELFKSLRTITDSLPDAAIILDESGHIRNLNAAAQSLFRLKPTDRGCELAALIREPDLIALIDAQIDTNLAEFASPFSTGVRLEARRIEMPDGQAMLLVRDVTELNRLLSMRQDFIANVSHELRTPLTVIVGYIETLLDEGTDEGPDEGLDHETTIELVGKLLSPTTRMRALVDDLLLLTRLESSPNPAPEELAPVDMGVILNAIANDARGLSAGRHQITIHQQEPSHVRGIDSELHSACLNLVTNAVRYSPEGGAIDISWVSTPSGARFAVQDHGLGVAREHLSRITERFYRVDFAQSRVRGGTGLGLAIVKHVLKRHNSRLQVESELASGSTFFCDFPRSQLTVSSAPA